MPYFVYLLSNARRTVLYTGVTRNLARRVEAHRSASVAGFTKRYNVTDLLYFETFDDIHSAIAREKQIKGGSRARKEALIHALNPMWRDLSSDLLP
ncbi:MAG: GIY-YIG nuclease family protein [Rhodothermales bacterium]|nr:GIY-YIG nuclease family protein [Rhodothermales bacterium]